MILTHLSSCKFHNRKTSRVRTTASYCFIMTSCRLFSLFQHSIAFISIEGNPKIGGFSCTSVLLESDSGWTRQQSSNTKTGGQRLRVSSEKMPLSVQRLFTFLTCHGSYKDYSVITIKLITIYDNDNSSNNHNNRSGGSSQKQLISEPKKWGRDVMQTTGNMFFYRFKTRKVKSIKLEP